MGDVELIYNDEQRVKYYKVCFAGGICRKLNSIFVNIFRSTLVLY